jgi:hypothetical protein
MRIRVRDAASRPPKASGDSLEPTWLLRIIKAGARIRGIAQIERGVDSGKGSQQSQTAHPHGDVQIWDSIDITERVQIVLSAAAILRTKVQGERPMILKRVFPT